MTRLLVTGASGFIGRHCLRPALDAGYAVHAVSSRPVDPAAEAGAGIVWHRASLLDGEAAERLIAEVRPTHLLHFAWETGHGSYWTSPLNLDWLAATARIAGAFARHGGRRFVSAGTCAEYDWSTGVLSEASVPRPATFYGRIKLSTHDMLMAAADQFGFSAAVGRIFFAYGPYENPARIIPTACRLLASGEEARFTSGEQARDFLFVEDAAEAFLALVGSAERGAVNISSGAAVTTADVVRRIGAISGRGDLVKLGALPQRPGDPPLLVGPTDRLSGLGWRPRVGLDEGLERTYRWWADRLSRSA